MMKFADPGMHQGDVIEQPGVNFIWPIAAPAESRAVI
jgi:hypothetical protein